MTECKWMLRILGNSCLAQLQLPKYAVFRLSDGMPIVEAGTKAELLVKMAIYGFKLNDKTKMQVCRNQMPNAYQYWTEIYLHGIELKGI